MSSSIHQLSLVIAVASLGRAIQISNGAWHPDAFKGVAVAFAFALLPLVVPARPALERICARLLVPAIVVAFALQFGFLSRFPPGIYLRLGPLLDITYFHLWLAAAAVLAAMSLADPGRRSVYGRLLLVVYLAMGLWLLRASPAPFIDVWQIHQRSAAALLQGVNPYTITFPNIYGHTQYFPPGTATAKELLFGYVYPPWNLLAALPGYLLAGDYRYAFLAATAISGGLMGLGGRGRYAVPAMALFLFTSRSFFVLEQGWTEPVLILPLVAAVFFASGGMLGGLAAALGILGVAKQYSLIAAPAALLLRPLYPSWRAFAAGLGKMVLVAAVVSLPLVLWNAEAFWHNVYAIQFSMPFRADSLSAPVWWLHTFGSHMPSAVQLGAPLLLLVLLLWRAPRTPGGFAWAAGTIYFAFFVFRQGFCNYYYLVIAAYCLALAWSHDTKPAQPDHDRGPQDSLDSAGL